MLEWNLQMLLLYQEAKKQVKRALKAKSTSLNTVQARLRRLATKRVIVRCKCVGKKKSTLEPEIILPQLEGGNATWKLLDGIVDEFSSFLSECKSISNGSLGQNSVVKQENWDDRRWRSFDTGCAIPSLK